MLTCTQRTSYSVQAETFVYEDKGNILMSAQATHVLNDKPMF